MRCPTCGRLPDEECCEKCHRVQAQLERTPLWAKAKSGNEIVPARHARRRDLDA